MGSVTDIAGLLASLLPRKAGSQAHEAQPAPLADDHLKRAHAALLEGVRALNEGNDEKALEALNAAFIAYRCASDSKAASLVQKTISLIIQNCSKPQVVRRTFRSSARALAQAGLHDEVVRLLMFNAEYEAREGDFAAAENLFLEALRVAVSHRDDAGRVEALCRRAIVASMRGKTSDCRKHVAAAREVVKYSLDSRTKAVFETWSKRALAPRKLDIRLLARSRA